MHLNQLTEKPMKNATSAPALVNASAESTLQVDSANVESTTQHGKDSALVSYREQVESFVNSGRKIPNILFKANPALCLQLRNERNETAKAIVSAALASGESLVSHKVSVGGVRTIKLKPITDGTPAQKRKATAAAYAMKAENLANENAALLERIKRMEAVLLEKAANAAALPV
jgi:hypothetical protein